MFSANCRWFRPCKWAPRYIKADHSLIHHKACPSYYLHWRPDGMFCLVLFYVLATYKFISGQVPTCHPHGDFIVLPHWETRQLAP